MLRGISSEKVKPFHINLKPAMSNLANCRLTLKKYKKNSSSLYSNFILNAYIVCELNNWPLNHVNNFPVEICLFCTVKFLRKKIKSEFTYNI